MIFHIFPVDRFEHNDKVRRKIILFTNKTKITEGFQDICFHCLGNPNILSIALKKRFLPCFFD